MDDLFTTNSYEDEKISELITLSSGDEKEEN